MRVLIVSKTQMHEAVCVGGLAQDIKQNIRLMQPGGYNQPIDTEYDVGDIWELEFTPRDVIRPPHVEDVIVHQGTRIGQVRNIKETLLKWVNVWQGSPTNLFDGLIRFTQNGSGYISARSGIPNGSVGFWVADEVLVREENFGKIRYHLPDNTKKITYVGVADAIEFIPARTLLRVSLARWWKPSDAEVEERCYLQLSGWYL
jgi:hypothetical protein